MTADSQMHHAPDPVQNESLKNNDQQQQKTIHICDVNNDNKSTLLTSMTPCQSSGKISRFQFASAWLAKLIKIYATSNSSSGSDKSVSAIFAERVKPSQHQPKPPQEQQQQQEQPPQQQRQQEQPQQQQQFALRNAFLSKYLTCMSSKPGIPSIKTITTTETTSCLWVCTSTSSTTGSLVSSRRSLWARKHGRSRVAIAPSHPMGSCGCLTIK